MERAQLRLSLAKVAPYEGESVGAYGYLRMDTVPLPGWVVEILADEVIIGSTSTDVEGNFSTFVSFRQGSFRVRARVPMLAVESNTIDVLVSPAPPVPPPPPPVVVVRPEGRVVELRADEFEAVFRGALREELPAVIKGMREEIYGIRPDYLYRNETLEAGKFVDINVVEQLGRVAKEGYLINDHDSESLWLTINDKSPIEVKAGEIHPMYKKDASKVWVENKATVGIPYRLELR